ncbi:hypothetical protein JCM8547_005790 [Rhodosporidiobolus lusitaniae]
MARSPAASKWTLDYSAGAPSKVDQVRDPPGFVPALSVKTSAKNPTSLIKPANLDALRQQKAWELALARAKNTPIQGYPPLPRLALRHAPTRRKMKLHDPCCLRRCNPTQRSDTVLSSLTASTSTCSFPYSPRAPTQTTTTMPVSTRRSTKIMNPAFDFLNVSQASSGKQAFDEASANLTAFLDLSSSGVSAAEPAAPLSISTADADFAAFANAFVATSAPASAHGALRPVDDALFDSPLGLELIPSSLASSASSFSGSPYDLAGSVADYTSPLMSSYGSPLVETLGGQSLIGDFPSLFAPAPASTPGSAASPHVYSRRNIRARARRGRPRGGTSKEGGARSSGEPAADAW